MTKLAAVSRPLLFLFLVISLTGCFQLNHGSLDEEKDPHVLEGGKRAKRMDWDGAIAAFERALQTNPNNSVAHFQLGGLYTERKKDFVSGLYHYQRHLTVRPDSPMADVVKQRIMGCKQELASSVAFVVGTVDVQRQVDRLNQTNSLLQQHVLYLQKELAQKPLYLTNYVTNTVVVTKYIESPASQNAAQDQPSPVNNRVRTETPAVASRDTTRARTTPAVNTTPRQAPRQAIQRSTRSHVIRKGETATAIARRYSVSIQSLRSANPGVNLNKIQAGETLAIPAR